MGALETFLRSACLSLIVSVQTAPAIAQANAPSTDPLHLFATCAGRLSAQVEDQWMFDGPASEKTAAELGAMAALIDASIAPSQGAEVMNWRINAKVAYRALLHQVRFGTDPGRAAIAAARAETLAAECRSLMLS
jgi:hypothetical protein